MIRSAKRLAAGVIYQSGLWRRFHRPDRIPVLMYHRVVPPSEAPHNLPGMYVTDGTFRMHLEFLRRHFRILHPGELLDRLSRTPENGNGAPACLITFDDGWRSVYDHAWPVFQEHDVPATIFLVTDTLRGGVPAGSRFMSLLERIHDLPPQTRALAATLAGEMGIRIRPDSAWTWAERDRCLQQYKTRPPAVRQEMERRLADRAPALDGAFLTVEQAGEMGGSGLVSFGSHTCSHALLDQLSSSASRRELRISFRTLAGEVPGFFPVLAYPNGNVTSQLSRLALKAGYRLAVTTRAGRARPGGPPMMTPRIAIHQDIACRTPLFVCRLMGIPGF